MRTENQNRNVTHANKTHAVARVTKIVNPLEYEIKQLSRELASERKQTLRLEKEYKNFRRRTRKDLKDLEHAGNHSLWQQIIAISDDFDLALTKLTNDTDPISEPLKSIIRRLQNLMLDNNVTPFDSQGELFDPEIHEAFDVIARTEKHGSGTVHSEVRRGYLKNGKVLRPAIVVVAQ